MIFIFSFQKASGQTAEEIRQYIDSYKEIALEQETRYGIPASITLAQGILESGAGTGYLAVNANNHFGIKAYGGWKGETHYAWDDEKRKSQFRKYNSPEASFRDHATFLSENPRYSNLFNISVFDYRSWAFGLQKAGYATAPNYGKELIFIIESNRLYSLNGGVRLKPDKTVTITQYRTEIVPVREEITVVEFAYEFYEEGTETAHKDITQINDVWCTVICPGQDISTIAELHQIPAYKLMEYNDLTSEQNLKTGDILFLKKKKTRYKGGLDYYTVKEGETLHSISQKFGIRLNSLVRMNRMSTLDIPEEGTTLRLR